MFTLRSTTHMIRLTTQDLSWPDARKVFDETVETAARLVDKRTEKYRPERIINSSTENGARQKDVAPPTSMAGSIGAEGCGEGRQDSGGLPTSRSRGRDGSNAKEYCGSAPTPPPAPLVTSQTASKPSPSPSLCYPAPSRALG